MTALEQLKIYLTECEKTYDAQCSRLQQHPPTAERIREKDRLEGIGEGLRIAIQAIERADRVESDS